MVSLKRRHCILWMMAGGFILVCMWVTVDSVLAQVMGELAEMDRLEHQAEELAAQADPEGASQTFGKAAMMANILSKETQDSSTRTIFVAASLLYRAQERGLRAVALFERAGGQPPAPAGVCQWLSQSSQKLNEAEKHLEPNSRISQEDLQERQRHLLDKVHEWSQVFHELQEDFACTRD
jgi:hypothetical protein